MFSRRAAIGVMATSLTSLVVPACQAFAADYPARPIRFLVGYPPGAATDIIARLIGQQLSEKLSQQFVIENRHGSCAERGARRLQRAVGQLRELAQRHALCEFEIQLRAGHRSHGVVQPAAERG